MSSSQNPDVLHLREWMSKQPHLPYVQDDAFLERFLLGCKNSLSRCKEVLGMYYTVRAEIPELFRNRDPTSKETRDSAKTAFLAKLPELTPAGFHVQMHGLLDPEAGRFNPLSFMRRLFMHMDVFLASTWCAGAVIVVDLAGASLGHLGGFSPSLLRTFLLCAQDAWPSRIREFHLINGPPLTEKIFELVNRYVKEKTVTKIHVHKCPEMLYDFIPQEILPYEYGGMGGSIKDLNDAAQEELELSREWLAEEERKLAGLPRRIKNNTINLESCFGLDGSFRRLTID